PSPICLRGLSLGAGVQGGYARTDGCPRSFRTVGCTIIPCTIRAHPLCLKGGASHELCCFLWKLSFNRITLLASNRRHPWRRMPSCRHASIPASRTVPHPCLKGWG